MERMNVLSYYLSLYHSFDVHPSLESGEMVSKLKLWWVGRNHVEI
jgi:hypothetical protein